MPVVKKQTRVFFSFASMCIVSILMVELIQLRLVRTVTDGDSSFSFQAADKAIRRINHNNSVAYVITVTGNCDDVLDGAAVLAESIRNVSQYSAYRDYEFVAIVESNIPLACRSDLSQLGYRVINTRLPFRVDELVSGAKISKGTGCCGIQEYLKLYAFNMTMYSVVVHVDVDVLFFKPLDHLYNILLKRKSAQPSMLKTIPSNHQLIPVNLEFLFVREYTEHNKRFPTNRIKNGIQGAFFILKPSQQRFSHLIQFLKKTKYEEGWRGWGGEGFGGYWGAAQIQGFLSYYYYIHSDLALELDHCIYNTLGFDIRYLKDSDFSPEKNATCRTGEKECDDCSVTPFHQIYVGHLSSCNKPWWCRAKLYIPDTPVCGMMQAQWFEYRRGLTERYGLTHPPPKPVYPGVVDGLEAATFGYCQLRGKKGYVKLRLPDNGISVPV